MSKPPEVPPNILRYVEGLFGPSPRGGGGRVGRHEAMKSLAIFIIQGDGHERLISEVLYNWSAREGVTPNKAREYLFHLVNVEFGNPPEAVFEIIRRGKYATFEDSIVRWKPGEKKTNGKQP